MSSGRRIAIIGESGCGKSTLMNMLIMKANRLILFDRLLTRDKFAKKAGLKHITRLEDLIPYLITNYERGFRVWYQPAIGKEAEEFSKLCFFLIEMQGTIYKADDKSMAHITVAADELKNILPSHSLPQGMNGGKLLCSEGRHYNLTFIGATQRPAQVSTEFKGNLNVRYLMRLTEPVDQKAVIEMTGRKEMGPIVRDLAFYKGIRVEGGKILHFSTTPQ